jgi:hypothetical protein
LFLDLLGLEVDLEEVVLDVSAVAGEGRLLGNLLSGVASLLGSGGSGLLDNLLGGSLLEGLLDNISLPGSDGEEGGSDEGDGESTLGSVKDSASDAFADVPLDEILTSVLKELIDQFVGDSSSSEGSDSGSDA